METTIPTLNSNVAARCKPQVVPVVCIGMSSGGIWPLRTIFKQLSTKTGLAFVVIHHVRNVPTLLPELLSAWTEMPVALAVEGESVCPNSLSGVDADGAAALKIFRRRGGITIAQEPRTAERPGMPASAIRTGVVDDVLPPEAIAGKLEQLAQQLRGSTR